MEDQMRAIRELADLLRTNLDSETIRILVQLCEHGVDPDLLAQMVIDLRHDKAKRERSLSSRVPAVPNGSHSSPSLHP